MESQKVHDEYSAALVNWSDVRFITFDNPYSSEVAKTLGSSPETSSLVHGPSQPLPTPLHECQQLSLEVIEQMLYEQRYKRILANLSVEHPFNVSCLDLVMKVQAEDNREFYKISVLAAR